MRLTTLILWLVAITVVACGVAEYAFLSINISGVSSVGESAAHMIRQRCPVRLVQPEWILSESNESFKGMEEWWFAEVMARLSLVACLWLGSVVFVIWYYARECRHRKIAQQAALAA